jgi:hypothetical protein
MDTENTNFIVGNQIFNNTIYGSLGAGIRVRGDYELQGGAVTNNLIKNNIAVASTGPNLSAQYGGENDGTYGSGNVYTYNNFGPESANFINWGDGTYKSTYATWYASAGAGAGVTDHYLNADPLFVSTTTPDFHLQAGSPAINAGIMVYLPTGSNLVTNGTFASDTGWTDGLWVIAVGVATKTAGIASNIEQSISVVAGTHYYLTYTMTRTAGTLTPQIGGTNGTVRSTAGTYSEEIVASTTGNLKFQADSTFTGTIDNVTAYAMIPLSSDYDGYPIGPRAFNGRALYNPDIGAYQIHQTGSFGFGF